MPTKILAWVLSFLSVFALWNVWTQPNHIPETRVSPYGDEMPPNQYGIWPTEEFTVGKKPFWLSPNLLKAALNVNGLIHLGSKTDSLLIMHKGKLVYEKYFNGYDMDKRHKVHSITKSVVSALVGIAIGEGKIGGIQDKVIDYFPEAVIQAGQESKKDMTIEHLLTMTSGIVCDTQEKWDAAFKTPGQSSALGAFLIPQKYAPGKKHVYDDAPPSILLGIVDRVTGGAIAYASEKLFKPLGMDAGWETAPDGLPYGGFGIEMTPRNMLRFGYLYLNYGRWEDQQIIPADWVAKTPPKSKSLLAYGHLFWNYPLSPFSGSYEAVGVYGQYIVIQPSRDLVIVRTGDAAPINKLVEQIGSKLGLL